MLMVYMKSTEIDEINHQYLTIKTLNLINNKITSLDKVSVNRKEILVLIRNSIIKNMLMTQKEKVEYFDLTKHNKIIPKYLLEMIYMILRKMIKYKLEIQQLSKILTVGLSITSIQYKTK